MTVDFGRTAGDYGQYRAGFPPELFERLAGRGIGERGQRVLDLGTGTGALGRGFALRGCTVTGLDISAALMAEARRLDQQARVVVRYVEGRAEETGLPEGRFDTVSAGQCWHWFDRPRAALEVKRLLVPGGWLLIAHFDWLPLPGNVVDATEALILRYNPTWHLGGLTGIYPEWPRDAGIAGFEEIETFTFDIDAPYSHEAWRGRIRASAGVAASLPPQTVDRFDADLATILRDRFPENPLAVPHRVFALTGRRPVLV